MLLPGATPAAPTSIVYSPALTVQEDKLRPQIHVEDQAVRQTGWSGGGGSKGEGGFKRFAFFSKKKNGRKKIHTPYQKHFEGHMGELYYYMTDQGYRLRCFPPGYLLRWKSYKDRKDGFFLIFSLLDKIWSCL